MRQPYHYPPIFVSTIVALVLLTIAFADVIFMGATLSINGQAQSALEGKPPIKYFTEPKGRKWFDQYVDHGGGQFQSEPAIHFLKHVLREGESLYWNPYSACGQLGPETLADVKIGLATLLIAALGASDVAFNCVFLLLAAQAVVCLHLLLVRFFKVTQPAAIASCIFYLMNGYSSTNMALNTAQSYLLFPITMLALLSFARSPNTLRFMCICAVQVIVLLNTFFPTTLLTLICAHAITFFYVLSRTENRTLRAKTILLQVASPLLALSLLAPFYFPIAENLKTLGVLSAYDQRSYKFQTWSNFIGFFGAKHFWDEFSQHYIFGPNHPYSYHPLDFFGSVSLAIAFCSLLSMRHRYGLVIAGCFLIIIATFSRAFGIFPLSEIIGSLPLLHSIRTVYLWLAAAAPLSILVAFGFDTIALREQFPWKPVAAVYAVLLASVAYLFFTYGFREPQIQYHRTAVILLLIWLPAAAVFMILMNRAFQKRGRMPVLICSALLGVQCAELFYETIHSRMPRSEHFTNPSAAIRYLKEHAGIERVVEIGNVELPPEEGSAHQIQQIESLNMSGIPDYLSYFQRRVFPNKKQRWGNFPTFQLMQNDSLSQLSFPSLNTLAVKYILVRSHFSEQLAFFKNYGCKTCFDDGRVTILENPFRLPRAYGVDSLILDKKTPEESGLATRLIAFTADEKLHDAAGDAGLIVNMPKNRSLPEGDARLIPDSAVKISDYHNARVTISTNWGSPFLLVLSDNWHPDWKTKVDGRDVYTGKINSSFRGVVVPRGKHIVTMQYHPQSLPAAMALSGLAVLMLAVMAVLRGRLDTFMRPPAELQAVIPKASEHVNV